MFYEDEHWINRCHSLAIVVIAFTYLKVPCIHIRPSVIMCLQDDPGERSDLIIAHISCPCLIFRPWVGCARTHHLVFFPPHTISFFLPIILFSDNMKLYFWYNAIKSFITLFVRSFVRSFSACKLSGLFEQVVSFKLQKRYCRLMMFSSFKAPSRPLFSQLRVTEYLPNL